MDSAGCACFDSEIAGRGLADERLTTRLGTLLAQLGGGMGQSIPMVCQDWADTNAAYRFFSNERVNEADILAAIFNRRAIEWRRSSLETPPCSARFVSLQTTP